MAMRSRLTRWLLILIAAQGLLSTSAVTAFILTNEKNPDNRAIIRMGVALILIWCILGGVLTVCLRDRFVAWATRIPLGWRTRFVLLCIAFVTLEGAVTSSLTVSSPSDSASLRPFPTQSRLSCTSSGAAWPRSDIDRTRYRGLAAFSLYSVLAVA